MMKWTASVPASPASKLTLMRTISFMPVPSRVTVPALVAENDGQFTASPIGGNIHEMVDLAEAPRLDGAEVATRRPTVPR